MDTESFDVVGSIDATDLRQAVDDLLALRPKELGAFVVELCDSGSFASLSQRMIKLRVGQTHLDTLAQHEPFEQLVISLAASRRLGDADLHTGGATEVEGPPKGWRTSLRSSACGVEAKDGSVAGIVTRSFATAQCQSFLDALLHAGMDGQHLLGVGPGALVNGLALAINELPADIVRETLPPARAASLFSAISSGNSKLLRGCFWPGHNSYRDVGKWLADMLSAPDARADLWEFASAIEYEALFSLAPIRRGYRDVKMDGWFSKHTPGATEVLEALANSPEAQSFSAQAAAAGHEISEQRIGECVIGAYVMSVELLVASAATIVESGLIVAVSQAARRTNETIDPASMIAVNQALPKFAAHLWFDMFREVGDDWIPGFLSRFPENDLPPLAMAVDDLLPWISAWPQDALSQLRDCLDYDLHHRPEDLVAFVSDFQDVAYCIWPDPIEGFWMPLYRSLFGSLPKVAPEPPAYRLLERDSTWGQHLRLEEELGQPDWPWYRAVKDAMDEAALAQDGLVVLRGMSTPGRAFRQRGLTALDQALHWRDSGETSAWQIPADMPYPSPPIPYNARRLWTSKPYCSEGRSQDLEHPTVSERLDDYLDILVEVGEVLGLDPANGYEANIASAHRLENFDRIGMRPFHTWATLVQATLDAIEHDCVLVLMLSRPLDDHPALQDRIDRKLAEYDVDL